MCACGTVFSLGIFSLHFFFLLSRLSPGVENKIVFGNEFQKNYNEENPILIVKKNRNTNIIRTFVFVYSHYCYMPQRESFKLFAHYFSSYKYPHIFPQFCNFCRPLFSNFLTNKAANESSDT